MRGQKDEKMNKTDYLSSRDLYSEDMTGIGETESRKVLWVRLSMGMSFMRWMGFLLVEMEARKGPYACESSVGFSFGNYQM